MYMQTVMLKTFGWNFVLFCFFYVHYVFAQRHDDVHRPETKSAAFLLMELSQFCHRLTVSADYMVPGDHFILRDRLCRAKVTPYRESRGEKKPAENKVFVAPCCLV